MADLSQKLPESEITGVVIQSFYSTYNELGPGFPEYVTRRALAIVIRQAGLEAHEETFLPVWFSRTTDRQLQGRSCRRPEG